MLLTVLILLLVLWVLGSIAILNFVIHSVNF